MYDIWLRNHREPDVNLMKEYGLIPYKTLEWAINFCETLKADYSHELWEGDRFYKAEFYVTEHDVEK